MAAWPGLPAPQLDNYVVNTNAEFIRTEMDLGLARQRRRTTARIATIQTSVKLFEAQLETFEGWFEADTGARGGVEWFTMPLKNGQGLSTWTVRFIEPWTVKTESTLYVVSMVLETLDRPV